MSKYIIHNGTFYSTDSGELMHWKYVKREKKNGKWVYTYDNVNSGTATKSTKVKDTNKWLSSETTVNVNGDKHVTYNRGKLERLANTAANKLGIKEKIDNRTKDWYESKDRSTEKAAENAKKKGGELIDTDKLGSSKTTLSINGRAVSTRYNRGKLERYTDTAKEYIKDRLGFDEKDAYDKSQEEVNETTGRTATALINAKNAYDFAEKYGDDYYYEKYKNRADEYDTAKAAYDKAVSERDKAKESYYDTPIGKLAESGEKIGYGLDYVEGLFKRKSTYKSDELKELDEFERQLAKRKKRKK